MNDRQLPTKPQPRSLPIISPVLHVLAMPLLVFLRWDFGYSFLRPKSIIFAFAWAFSLFAIYCWHDQHQWQHYLPILIFGASALILYLFHLFRSFLDQFSNNPRHDNFSGKSWIDTLASQFFHQEKISLNWLEPILIVAITLIMQKCHFWNLTQFLIWTGSALTIKESINYWTQIRKIKLHHDILEDAEDQIQKAAINSNYERIIAVAPTTRKQKIRRRRTSQD